MQVHNAVNDIGVKWDGMMHVFLNLNFVVMTCIIVISQQKSMLLSILAIMPLTKF